MNSITLRTALPSPVRFSLTNMLLICVALSLGTRMGAVFSYLTDMRGIVGPESNEPPDRITFDADPLTPPPPLLHTHTTTTTTSARTHMVAHSSLVACRVCL